MISKKYIVAAGAVAAALTGMVVLTSVHAQETSTTANVSVTTRKQPQVVEIGPTGRALVRGTVETVGTNSITVKSWGGSWVVNIASTTTLAPRATISQFVAGDFVGVQGAINASAMWTIDATLVRNWTERKEIRAEKQETRKEAIENKQEIKATVKAVTARNWEGVASEVNNDTRTFKLMVGETAYSVTLATNAKIVGKGFATIDFNAIKNGDMVHVYGPATETTITASAVRSLAVTPLPSSNSGY